MRNQSARSIGFALAGLVVGAVLMSPATGHISDSPAHLWKDHIQEKADAAYAGKIKIVVESHSVDSNQSGGGAVFCPQGYEAIAGGISGQYATDMFVTESGPVWGRPAAGNVAYLVQKVPGTYKSATGWSSRISNVNSDPATANTAAVCAKK